ncbi:MAG: ATP phosphoribosyltransferase [Dokdonella sp.]|jgi:ATP phosphoribosyltransferase|uniref:ATP phosphoribosyltransferase n=1 Tax=Dokdonella sp. TaxID=2291710 RepID=UPI001B7A6247|nr:ATP phosphoribosyltransferase [Dokdonella sp.]MBK8124067.1 ATP phosphoribosyltransferase [Dokdonella sp.]MBP6326797.1 ATP phosphoribosyltransferase [Dokdonella sp.]MBP6329554.1 ATP phosphoribosyltransferase [Dokdonella sp.]HNV08763.1 ATP phosphoribosyltransferase [Dokdonella sp.]HPW04377.1 ATP phosphoribosyltransferase [Dokdonella sp.]
MSLSSAPSGRDRLRIAIQKNGRLSDPARALLGSCGLSWRESPDRLFCYGDNAAVDLLLVRDDDIPGLIDSGLCDLGIVGRNVLAEQASERVQDGRPGNFREWRALGFGGCRLSLAIPNDRDWQSPAQLQGRRIATSYPALTRAWLQEQGVTADVVVLTGSVEIAPRLGQAEAICDLVSSGATLAANQLKPVCDLLQSEAVLAGPLVELEPELAGTAHMLLRRIDGVLRIRDSKLLMFQAPRDAVAEVLRLLPDAEPPTSFPVDGSELLAMQALCHGVVTWQRLEELKRAGACGLMVLPVERMLA